MPSPLSADGTCELLPTEYSRSVRLHDWLHTQSSLTLCKLMETPWTINWQAPLFLGFPRQECWSRLPFPSPGDLPNPGIKPRSPEGRFFYLLSHQGSLIILCWGPAPADPGYSKGRRLRRPIYLFTHQRYKE